MGLNPSSSRSSTVERTGRMLEKYPVDYCKYWSWSGCRDLNSGPLAPQATNINHLQTIPTENKRFTRRRFGRHLDAKTRIRAVWTPNGLHSRASPVR